MEADSESHAATKVAEDPVDAFVRRQDWLDAVADPIQKVVGGFYAALGGPGRILKDLLHGTKPLGHPLHPALTDVPLGAWTVMVAADLLALVTRTIPPVAGDVALGVGVAGALAAAVAGYTDFHETYGQERRVGMLHGLVMTFVLIIMAASLGIRLVVPSARPIAILIAIVGWVVAVVGGYLGGHLTFRYGTMVNRNAFIEFPTDFVNVGSSTDFIEGRMEKVQLDAGPLLVLRRAGRLYAISNVCSHAGGPLADGMMENDTVICPWHGSRFCVLDGRVEGGPATFNQPAFTVREKDGKVEVKVSIPSH